MNKIIYDIELLTKQQNKDIWNYYRKYTNQIKNKKDLVKLSLYCTKYCFEFNNEKTKPYSKKCIELIEKYLINPKSVTQQDLSNAADTAANAAWTTDAAYVIVYASKFDNYDIANCLYWCSQIKNINMFLPHQYIQILLRTTKQFNTENQYSNYIKQIVKQDIDKLELVDYNMLLDISNEHYNIGLSDFCYDNIFSRRNLIEMIRREYES